MAAEPGSDGFRRDFSPICPAEAEQLLAPLAELPALALAVSGGPDSLALMRLVAGWRAGRAKPRVLVLTVDHGLRAESRAEAERVQLMAQAAGLRHEILTWEGDRPRRDIQSAARAARYRLMAERCHQLGIGDLATAHHLDDQAETLLLRLARGSGVDGLAAMAFRSIREGLTIHRPLLDVPKSRLVATLAAAGVAWSEDPSNTDPAFARARLRALAPALAAEGLTPRRLADTARRMRRAREALESAAAALTRESVSVDRAGFCRIVVDRLGAAPEEIALRVLARLVMAIGGADYPPRLDRLERLHGWLAAGGAQRGATLAGCRFVRAGAHVLVMREEGRTGLPEVALGQAAALVWDRRFRIAASSCPVPVTSVLVKPLGRAGLAVLKAEGLMRPIPALAARTTPALYDGERLVAAPLAATGGPFAPAWLEVSFLGATRFAGGGH
ncbi:tRNA(Ile)-lysidine synthase [Tepidamorphus gemmatus]|uniref:tRNA(Ile)-lysidine synthase n=1 Tax=Tepidamorphus gemmatus TaxID=747076 RepID=A0A4R3MHP6_9HYPH|nr:tRNA lysidine(34) synthetase TilS [Tepidamorphus gemmatus]TCT13361.1 tRNA(Ile)-lysidine synthase [Tepidamorphus gemmatus]